MSKKSKNLREFKASYDVDASVADATGVTAAPPGGSQSAGDKAGNPKPEGSTAPKGKAEMISAMVDKYKDMDDKDLQDAYDQLTTPPDKENDDTTADSAAKTDKIKNEENGDDDDFDFDFSDDEDEVEESADGTGDDGNVDGKAPNKLDTPDVPNQKGTSVTEEDDEEKVSDGDKEEVKEEDGDEDMKDKDDEKKDAMKAESFKVTKQDLNLGEDLKVIFKGSQLTEEVKAKATEIFEAAVVVKVNEQVKKMRRVVESNLKHRASGKLRKLAERMDTYLGYVVEQWMKENKVAIESGLQREIVEDFVGGLHRLFSEHYIAVPSNKEDIVERLTKENEALRHSLNEEVKQNAEAKAKADAATRQSIVKEATAKLTDVAAAKITQIAEALSYTTPQEYRAKVQDLCEAYSQLDEPKPGSRTLEEGNELEPGDETPSNSSIAAYAKQIARDSKK